MELTLKIDSRNYNSDQFRPTPMIYTDHENKFTLILTSWGSNEYNQKVMSHLTDFIQTALADVEVTSPYEFIPTLSKECNILRVASLLTNSFIYRELNSVEYQAGYELVAFIQNKEQVSWLQLGQCELYKPHQNELIPIEVNASFEDVPIPDQLLGLESQCYPKIGEVFLKDEKQILLVSRSQATSSNIVSINHWNLQSVVTELSRKSPDTAFWISFLNFSDSSYSE